MRPASLTVGTAGHIDHGKTALVAALTGTNTDRLAEERRRGISIELGFAELVLPGRSLSLIDVPGHQRLVRTMIAGATGIDLFLLVIAADDGVMPQTREHLAVLGALGVSAGVVAITKCDAVEGPRRRLTAEEAARLLPGHPVIEVSARCGQGIAALKEALAGVAGTVEVAPSLEEEQPLLHVDRVFTIDGHGTVLTGTLQSGRIERGQRIVVLPSGREARVRAIESHGRASEVATPRRRTALNLSGLARDQVARGDVVSVPGSSLRPSYRLDVRLLDQDGVRRLQSGTRIHVHHGTREAPARVALIDERGQAQLRLERPLIAACEDRVVLRQLAPPDTLGGAIVIDPAPPRRGRHSSPPEEPATKDKGAEPGKEPRAAATRLSAEPAVELDALATQMLSLLALDGVRPRQPRMLAAALGVEPARVEQGLRALAGAGLLTQVKPGVWFPASSLAEIRARTIELASRQGSISVAELRDELATSRRYAVALLEHFDAEKALIRRGERHALRRSLSSGPGAAERLP